MAGTGECSPEQTCLLPLPNGGVGLEHVRSLPFLPRCHGSSCCHPHRACKSNHRGAVSTSSSGTGWEGRCHCDPPQPSQGWVPRVSPAEPNSSLSSALQHWRCRERLHSPRWQIPAQSRVKVTYSSLKFSLQSQNSVFYPPNILKNSQGFE